MPTTTLKSAFAHRAVDASHLESLGKTAARMAESGDISLTEAVIKTASPERLNAEQVRRVVEYANTEAFNQKFASTSGSRRAVHIDGGPADPVEVLQSLNDAARPREVAIDSLEYTMPPDHFGKTSSSPMFTTTDRTVDGVLGEVRALQHQLYAAHDELTQTAEAAKSAMNSSFTCLIDAVQDATSQGASATEIYEAWEPRSEELAKTAFDRTRSLMRDSVKVAGRSVNPGHAVVLHFDDFVKSASSYEAHHNALMALEAEIIKVAEWVTSREDGMTRDRMIAIGLLKQAAVRPSDSHALGEGIKNTAKAIWKGTKAVAHHGGNVAEGVGVHRGFGNAAALAALAGGTYLVADEGKNRGKLFLAEHGIRRTPNIDY